MNIPNLNLSIIVRKGLYIARNCGYENDQFGKLVAPPHVPFVTICGKGHFRVYKHSPKLNSYSSYPSFCLEVGGWGWCKFNKPKNID